MVINISLQEFIGKSPNDLQFLKEDLMKICRIIDFLLNEKRVVIEQKSQPKPEKLPKDQSKTHRNKISSEVEKIMKRIILENNNGKTITELYELVLEECEVEELDAPSAPTFYRRYTKSHKAPKINIEPIPLNEKKKEYRNYMKAQENDLKLKTGMYEP